MLLLVPLRVSALLLLGLGTLGTGAWLAGMEGPALAGLASLLAAWACAAAVASCHDANEAARWVAVGWLAAGLASSAMALLQYFGLALWLGPWIHHAQTGEAFANLRQRNQFATLTSLALLAFLWCSGSWPRVAKVAAVVLLAAANAASASRTGLFQWLLIATAIAAWPGASRGPWLRLCLGALAVYAVGSAVLPKLLEAATGHLTLNVADRILASVACSTRWTLWPNVLELILQRPWAGWGWGELDYAHYIHPYAGLRFCDILDNAHNLPMHVAVELGVPMALLMCGVLTWWMVMRRPWREATASGRMAWLAIGAILLHSLVEYPLWYGPFQMAAGLAIGLLWAPGRPALMEGNRLRMGGAWLAGAAAAALAYAAWDYHRISQLYLPSAERAEAYRDDTLAKARRSWLFRDHVRFAELGVTAVTPANAAHMLSLAQDVLHFSPEPQVIQKLLEAALVLGRDDLVALHLDRFRAAFPQEYHSWMQEHAAPGR